MSHFLTFLAGMLCCLALVLAAVGLWSQALGYCAAMSAALYFAKLNKTASACGDEVTDLPEE